MTSKNPTEKKKRNLANHASNMWLDESDLVDDSKSLSP